MKHLMKYFKSYRLRAVLAPLFKMLEAGFELLVPLVMAEIIDHGIKERDSGYVLLRGGLLLLLGLVGLFCSVTAQYFSAKTAMAFGKAVRNDLFLHIQSLSFRELDRLGSATLITRMTSDVNQVQTGVNMFLRLFMRSPFIVFGAAIMAFFVDRKAGIVFFIAIPVLSLLVFWIMAVSIPLYRRVQERLDTVLLKTRETLAGVRVIRAFHREQREAEEFRAVTEELTGGQLLVGRISAFLNPLTYVVINCSIAVLLWIGAERVDGGLMLTGGVYALVNYMSQILVELVKLANLIVTETKALACARRVSEVLCTTGSLTFPEAPAETASGAKAQAADPEAPVLEFRNVSFSYEDSPEHAVEKVSLSLRRGETLGIIGGTGSGKSTLVQLIPRFYDCTEGTVLVDGLDVRAYGKRELRKKVGMVFQRAALFSGSIEENLRMGDASLSEEQLLDALRTARAEDFVSEKEGGISFRLNRGARNVSGGQRQRLTIARALAAQPEILILDDSASALDRLTEAELRRELDKKAKTLTLVVVSQRTSSLLHADRILVLDNGKVAGLGTHETLLETCPLYREIHETQAAG